MFTVLAGFKVVLPLLYLGTFALYLWLFIGDDPTARRRCSQLAVLTVLLHLVALVLKAFALDRLPLGTPLEFFSALALALTGTYLVIEKRIKAKNTGWLVLGTAFLLQMFASTFCQTKLITNKLLQDPGFGGHVILAILAYTALSLSFLYAVLYLVLARQLGRRQFGLLFRRLPSLEVLERMSIGAIKLAVPMLFLSLCLGHLWMYDLADRVAPDVASQLSPFDPKILITWFIFLGYALGLVGHRLLGWRGRRMNILAVVAFLVVLGTTGVIHHFFPTFHKFRSFEDAFGAMGRAAPAPTEIVHQDGRIQDGQLKDGQQGGGQ